ncbi:MAG: response regulator [Chloroflexota bacterium]|nr:MAG: response regulator [Chloroflexota bacterium]
MAHVLFIDDDVDTLNTLKKAVELFGHQALLASDGLEALQQIEQEQVDLIITDLRLMDNSDVGIIPLLRSHPVAVKIPIVVHSAGSEAEYEKKVLAAGAQFFVSKPIRLQILLGLINRYSPPPDTIQPGR